MAVAAKTTALPQRQSGGMAVRRCGRTAARRAQRRPSRCGGSREGSSVDEGIRVGGGTRSLVRNLKGLFLAVKRPVLGKDAAVLSGQRQTPGAMDVALESWPQLSVRGP